MLKKRILTIEHDNPTQVEIIVANHQSDGVYRYQPEPEDEIKLFIYDNNGVTVGEFTADSSDPTYVFCNIDTTEIPAGEYRYKISLHTDADDLTYYISDDESILIRR